MEMYYISAFIDDELQLDEKIEFIQSVHADSAFKDEAVSLLRQEVKLRAMDQMPSPPSLPTMRAKTRRWEWFKPVGIFSGGLATALLLIALFWSPVSPPSSEQIYRFVVYQPDARQAAITGDFTDWRTVDMQSAGRQGYWEIYLPLTPGEYRYSFVLDGQRHVADPTQPVQEQDDFGGQNSILFVSPKTNV